MGYIPPPRLAQSLGVGRRGFVMGCEGFRTRTVGARSTLNKPITGQETELFKDPFVLLRVAMTLVMLCQYKVRIHGLEPLENLWDILLCLQ